MKKLYWPFFLTLSSFLIATFYGFVKITSFSLNPFSLSFIRFFWAAFGLGIVLVIQKSSFVLEKQDIFHVFLLGIIGQVIPSLGVIYGTRITGDSSTTSLLVNTTAVWVFLIVVILKKDNFVFKRFLGIVLGIIGITLVIFSQNNFSINFSFEKSSGYLSGIFSAVCIAVFGVFIEKYSKKYGPLKTTFYAFVSSVIFLFFCVLWNKPEFLIFFSIENILIGIYIGFFSLGIARLITVTAVRTIKPSKVYPFNFLIPVFTTILGILFFSETITLFFIIGGIITSFGIYLTQGESIHDR